MTSLNRSPMRRSVAIRLAFAAAAALAADAYAGTYPACDPSRSTQTVTLVHVTDLHAHYAPGEDGVSPYARIRGYFDSVRAAPPTRFCSTAATIMRRAASPECSQKGPRRAS